MPVGHTLKWNQWQNTLFVKVLIIMEFLKLLKCALPRVRIFLQDSRQWARVKPGFIGRQGSSDRSFYVSFTALTTDTCSERSYSFAFATNLLSDTALKICIARVISSWSHWIKASSEKTRLVLKGFLQNGAKIKHRDSSPVYFDILSKGFLH